MSNGTTNPFYVETLTSTSSSIWDVIYNVEYDKGTGSFKLVEKKQKRPSLEHIGLID